MEMADTTLPNAPAPQDQGDADDASEGLLPVELDSLRLHGHAPEEGDRVSLRVDGTVDHVEGNMAFIEPTHVNGKAVPEAQDNEQEPTEDSLQQKAQALDHQAQQSGAGY